MKSFEHSIKSFYYTPVAYEFSWKRVHSYRYGSTWSLQSTVGPDGHF